jgi:hypothetical protein
MNLAGLAMPCAYNYDGASVASRPCYSPYCAYAYCAARQKASGAKTAELDGFVGPFAINGSSGNMSSEAAVNGVDDPVAAAAAGTVGIWEPTARLGTRQGVSKSNENGTGKVANLQIKKNL